MTKELKALEAAIVAKQEELKKSGGLPVVSSENGPIGMGLIREIFKVLEAQQAEIQKLKALLRDNGTDKF